MFSYYFIIGLIYFLIGFGVALIFYYLMRKPLLGRFWQHRGDDGVAREKQLLIDYLAASAGGPMYYTGRDMKTAHRGMGITSADWDAFTGHLVATLDAFAVPERERGEVLAFIESTKGDIVEHA